MKQRITLSILTIALATILSACSGGDGELTVTDAWSRPAAAGNNGAIYFEISNNSGQDDALLRVESDVAGLIELHNVVMVDPADLMDDDTNMDGTDPMAMGEDDTDMTEGDMIMQMVPQENVPVPQGESVSFAPGGLHVMLIGLSNDLIEGDSFTATLVFKQAGEITITVSVEQN